MHRAIYAGLFACAVGVCLTTAPATALAQESALGALATQAKANPQDASAALAYGRALRKAGRVDEAIVVLRRGASLQASRVTQLGGELHWELSRAYVDRRDFGPAMVQCRVVQSRPGTRAAGHVCAAEAHLLWRRGSEVAVELAQAQKASGFGKEAQFAAKIAEGRARELELKEADAEAAYRAALHIIPDRPEALVRLGSLLHHMKKGGEAELEKAVDLEPRDPDALFALAAVRRGKDRVQLLERSIDERPTFPAAERSLALAQLDAGRVADAKRTSDKILARDPSDVASLVVSGRVALAEKRFADAIAAADKALAAQANSAPAKLLSADIRAAQGEIDLALEAYQAAWGLDHTDPAPLVNAAAACIKAHRLTSARAYAKKVTTEFPKDASAWIVMGDTHLVDGDKAQARGSYERAKGLGADPQLVERKLAGAR
jgi:tetratricopeptide (TPR) repeat protein